MPTQTPATSACEPQVGLEKAPPPDGRFLDTALLLPNGRLRLAYRPLRPLVEKILGFDQLWALHQKVIHPPYVPDAIATRVLEALDVKWSIEPGELARLRALTGPVVLTSNHPCGGIEFFALVRLLEAIRPDGWKFLANHLVCSVRGFTDNFIPLDPISGGSAAATLNRQGLVRAMRVVRDGGLLAAFPAGRVSHHNSRLNGALADRSWSPHFLQIAAKAGAHIVCLHIEGRTSGFFQALPASNPRLRALFLCREFVRPASPFLQVRLAAIRSATELTPDATGAARLRADCYLAADSSLPRPGMQPAQPSAVQPSREPLANPPANALIQSELQFIPEAHLLRHGGFDLYCVRGDTAPMTLQALGVARERTFRAAGQGTGTACDRAPEDDYYHHLILWDYEAARIAGAYRVGKVNEILRRHGAKALYLDHVFKIHPSLYSALGSAFELSRSFILPEYQRRPDALAGLWKGLGRVAQQEGVNTLFGSVTISNAHHPASRALLVEYLKQNHLDQPELRRKITARRPFAPATRYHGLVADAYRGAGIAALSPLIRRIENDERDIPPLMRYYCALGARYLDFHVEAAFQDALYCLLRVSLSDMPAAYKKRFLRGG